MRVLIFISAFCLMAFLNSCKEEDDIEIERSAITVVAEDNATEEGENGFFSIRLEERLSSDLVVDIALSGTAVNGDDYEEVSNSVTIAAGLLTEKIKVVPVLDTDEEGDEEIRITILGTDNEHVRVGNQSSTSIQLIDGPSLQDMIRAETRPFMANQNASDATVALFYNLSKIPEDGFIVGQHDAFSSFYAGQGGFSDIRKGTGSEPGLLGSDFMFITDDQNDETSGNWFYQQELNIKDDAMDAYRQGMVNVFVWHLREPYEGKSFYTNEMTDFQKENAFISILPGGENHEYYKRKLQKVAQVAKSMIGNDGEPIPLIFRPFHEFDGHWFWWGADYCTPQQFIQLWRFTVDYLTRDLDVNNMLFAYSPDNKFDSDLEYLERYPGDSYVDILAMDNYGDFNSRGQAGIFDANRKLKIISDLATAKGKIAAMSESCFFITPGETEPEPDFFSNSLMTALTKDEVKLSFFMFWSNNAEQYCTPPPGEVGFNDFLQFINESVSMLADDLPAMYDIIIPPDA